MKKLVFFLFSAFLLSTSVSALELVPLTFCIEEDEQPATNGFPKAPIKAPTVYIEDYTLTFEVNHPEYVLTIKDEDGAVVYSTVVYSSQTQVVLPSSLSGDYEIHLFMDNWLFTGCINL